MNDVYFKCREKRQDNAFMKLTPGQALRLLG